MKTNTRLLALALTLTLLLASVPAGAAAWSSRVTANDPTPFPTIDVLNYVRHTAAGGSFYYTAGDGSQALNEAEVYYALKMVIPSAVENGKNINFRSSFTGSKTGESWITVNGIPIGTEQNGETRVNAQTFLNAWAGPTVCGKLQQLTSFDMGIQAANLVVNGIVMENGQTYSYKGNTATYNNSLAAYCSDSKSKDFTLSIAVPLDATGTIEAYATSPGSKEPLFLIGFEGSAGSPSGASRYGALAFTLSNLDLCRLQTVNVGEWATSDGDSNTGGIVCVSGEVYDPAIGECVCVSNCS